MEALANENKICNTSENIFENAIETDNNESIDNKEDIKTVESSEIKNNLAPDNVKSFEDMWTNFVDFETFTYDPGKTKFTDFLTEWQQRLNKLIGCGLCYPETILSFKLIQSSNLDDKSRSNIFSTLYSHLESNILLYTVSALSKMKCEEDNHSIKLEDNNIEQDNLENYEAIENFEDLPNPEEVNECISIEKNENEDAKKMFECTHCPRTFLRPQELKKHQSCHNGPKKSFVCDICSASFIKQAILDDHMLVHNEESRLKCDLCVKEFFSEKTLKIHMKSVHKKHLSCDHCSKLFDRQSKLTAHMETHAKRMAASQGLFQCDQCGKEMQGKKRLRIHKRTHFQFRCQPCNKIFKDIDLLNRHVLNHREYPCIQCGLVFYQQALLIKHMNTITHGGERKFACDLCGKTFMKKYNLQTHQLTHTGEKNYRCEFQDCTMAFYKKDVMIRHMRIHTGEKPYQCDVCQRRFTQSGDLRKHSRTHANAERNQ